MTNCKCGKNIEREGMMIAGSETCFYCMSNDYHEKLDLQNETKTKNI